VQADHVLMVFVMFDFRLSFSYFYSVVGENFCGVIGGFSGCVLVFVFCFVVVLGFVGFGFWVFCKGFYGGFLVFLWPFLFCFVFLVVMIDVLLGVY
jgi:hypothetical protein